MMRDEVVGRVAVGDRRAGVDILGGDGAGVGLLAGQGGVGPGLGQVEQAVAVGIAGELVMGPSLSSLTKTLARGTLPVSVTT